MAISCERPPTSDSHTIVMKKSSKPSPGESSSSRTPLASAHTTDCMCVKSSPEHSHRFLRVEKSHFEVPIAFFAQMPPEIHNLIGFTSGRGLVVEEPLVFSGHTVDQFRKLLWAFISYPSIELRQFTLEELLSINELAHKYYQLDVRAWAISALAGIVNHPCSPLRTASSQLFLRVLRLAVLCNKPELSLSIQIKWITRLHWHQLSPTPAILIADIFNLRHLLSHAYYMHLVLMQSPSKPPRFKKDPELTPKQNMHVQCGYYSLMSYWRHLQTTPPEFKRSAQCDNHRQCVEAWKMRWYKASSRLCPHPEIDVLSRLRFMQDTLEADLLLGVCLTVQCRTQALASVSKKREEIANNLHHHFDL
ncbi:hypothetical protein BDQ12DRAFT_635964 [Crucibulum laeve]|uniref:BTB domain-containing protein n=1 Tax=Crucibulum laeve TaxID=68775 RepID=A0A5C3LPB9_9AGAR|nr:hypothetical protein BDQ12DRAFT_635964 [Crucibulum laeve]